MKRILHLRRVETSEFQRELWAAEAEHPVFAGSLHRSKPPFKVETTADQESGTSFV